MGGNGILNDWRPYGDKVKKKAWISPTEYGKSVGLSRQRISVLCCRGRLEDAAKKRGGKWLIHKKRADKKLKETLDLARHADKKPKAPKIPSIEEQEETIKKAGLKIETLNKARQIKENYLAALKQIEFERESETLVSAEEVKKVWGDHVQMIKSKLLNLPTKIAQEMQSIMVSRLVIFLQENGIELEISDDFIETAAIVKIIRSQINVMLKELADIDS